MNQILKTINKSKVINVTQLSQEQLTHILDGDSNGGGHGSGRGICGKSEFPTRWSDEQTIAYITEVVLDANSRWTQQNGKPGNRYTKNGKPIRWQIEGIRDAVHIKVIVEPEGKGIITAFPTNIPLNP